MSSSKLEILFLVAVILLPFLIFKDASSIASTKITEAVNGIVPYAESLFAFLNANSFFAGLASFAIAFLFLKNGKLTLISIVFVASGLVLLAQKYLVGG